MASKIPQKSLSNIIAVWVAACDVRAKLVMTNTTCDTEIDAINNLDDYTTIDVSDAAGYADVTCTGEAVAPDDGNNRAEFDLNDVVFSGLGGDATRDYQGVLLFDYVDGTLANDKTPIFIEFTAPIPKAATEVTVPWDVQGVVQFAQA
jgi:hypothetical protein